MFRNIKNPAIKLVCEYLVIAVASSLYAVGISLFIDPNNLAPGGVTGIAIIINHFLNMPTGVLVLVLNIPIMILGIWKFGLAFSGLEIAVLLVGMIVAFLVSMVVIKFLMAYIKRNDFKVFGWYRIVLGAIVLSYFVFFR